MISTSFGCRRPLKLQRSFASGKGGQDSGHYQSPTSDAKCIQIPQWMMVAAVPWLGQPALGAELSEGGFSKGSYYVTLGLFAVTLPGGCTPLK